MESWAADSAVNNTFFLPYQNMIFYVSVNFAHSCCALLGYNTVCLEERLSVTSALKMESLCSSQTLITTYQTTRCQRRRRHYEWLNWDQKLLWHKTATTWILILPAVLCVGVKCDAGWQHMTKSPKMKCKGKCVYREWLYRGAVWGTAEWANV